MAEVEKSVLVFYSARQMFMLVDRVEDYPHFLPWCGGSEVHRHSEEALQATVHIDYHHIKQSFTTDNHREEPHLIEIRLRHGPFSHLEGSWRFLALDESACKVEFRLRYEFSSRMLEKLVSPVFGYIANSFVDAFVQRATIVYGES